MKNKLLLGLLTIVLVTGFMFFVKAKPAAEESKKTNIIVIYLDDLGYGDVGAYGCTDIKTPNIDYLAKGGVMFTDAHSPSATCTPSRYGLLTGVYPWRNKKANILPGSAPLIIDTAHVTMPKILKKAGYKTAIIGKWHLGLGAGSGDWNSQISPGPNELGFDFSYIMAATQDRVPTVYIENGNVVNLDPLDPIKVDYKKNFEGQPTAVTHPELLSMKWHHGHNNSIVNGIPRIGYMKGGKSAIWTDVDMADHFLNKVKQYIKTNKNEPFFLYYAMQQPHVPRTPHPRFVGATALGPRGDVIVEADWCIGELIKTLKKNNLLDNTLIVLSSDNGPVLNDGYFDEAVEKLGKHKPAGLLRGGKYSLLEAGTRVPFITYWKGNIEPKVSNALVGQIDLLASLAAFVGLEENSTDSQNTLNVFLGKDTTSRATLVLEASRQKALRKGDWLMIPPNNRPKIHPYVNVELGNSKEYQLYNLKNDIEQMHNLAKSNLTKLDEMKETYTAICGKSKTKQKK